MKNTFLLLLCLSLFVVSCSKDDDTPEDNIDAELHYDTAPQDAPALDAGTYDLGARFPASVISGFVGRQLEEVSFYLLSVPSKCELLVYGEGTDSTPGSLLYSTDLTATVDGESWNTHVLSTPVEITDADIWLCVRVEHGSRIGSLGCDTGPASSNGDWMFIQSNNEWTSLRNFSNDEVNINWNIRGKLNEL